MKTQMSMCEMVEHPVILTGKAGEVEHMIPAYIDLLYSVAMKFARAHEEAETLVRETISCALAQDPKPDMPVKQWLLSLLRRQFIHHQSDQVHMEAQPSRVCARPVRKSVVRRQPILAGATGV